MLATARMNHYAAFDAMERRGRSRAIPPAALFRRELHHQKQLYTSQYRHPSPLTHYSRSRSRSESPESLSPKSITIEPITPPEYDLDCYYDSPPTPPQSLEDQIQEAYALDNIHLAKVLFLKLKGIEVVSDDDPRLDDVQDEDFPFSRLILDEEDEQALKESQKREHERALEKQRENKLAACEHLWDQSVTRYREERLKLLRLKEAVTLAAMEEKRIQLEREEQAKSRYLKQGGLSSRSLLSYKSLGQNRMSQSSSPPDSGFAFEYMIMRPSSPPAHSFRRMSGSAKTKREFLVQTTSSCSVPFRDVSASMRGSLFPFQPDQDFILPDRRKHSRVRVDLLEILLDTVRWEDGERKSIKGKGREQPFTWSSSTHTMCPTCSSTSKSSTSTLVSRSASWLNFGGRSSKLSSTSTPPASPMARTIPLIGNSTSSASSTVPLKPAHSCCGSRAVVVTLEDSPLYVAPARYRSPSPPKESPRTKSFIGSTIAKRMGTSVSSFLDIASQFQAAYMRATVFSVNLHAESIYSYEGRFSRSRSLSSSDDGDELCLKPVGYRVKTHDLKVFANFEQEDQDGVDRSVSLTPMLSPMERTRSTPISRSSSPITPSPLRPREPPTCLQYRIRPIGNPVLLRLRALQNVCCVDNLEWQGRAKEGTLGFGKERLTGVAFEGIGRSGLAWEVTPRRR